ncbi:hypothetical protein Q4534_22650 [Cyclobacterium sp. 1_MG-2023]|uniref:hypothetical protein n=1 Tax=Cyclobacterium sp. 1_MG-2023 TaxID=3062681 RepID=UPI0026E42496|nr:hypothetical protein [Cyclobacterium sp. 1_MG-2023]MDO6440246.1 hypothetical protein [Cyclobacterium sp. 1_MG-2023]
MKNLLYSLVISALAVIVFATFKILTDHYLYGWGILVAALVFIFTLTFWFTLQKMKKQQS